MEKFPLSGRLEAESFPHRHPRGTRVSADEEVVSAVYSIRRLHAMTTSRALIADSRRASRGRVEKSVTAMDCWRWFVSDATRTTCSNFAPITSRNRTKREQERRINRKRGT